MALSQNSPLRAVIRKPSAIIGAAWILIILVASFGASRLAPYSFTAINPMDMLQGPTRQHLLGTDLIGHDVLSLIMWAGKDVFFHGFIVVGLATLIGLPAGLLAGFYGGKVDQAIARVADILFALPGMIILIAVGALSGNNLSIAMVALGIMFSAGFMRQVRAAALAARGELYVDAAFVSGIGRMTIIFRHVMPNVVSPLFIQISSAFGATLLMESGLAFLGIAPPPPIPTWGGLITLAQSQLENQPWLMVPTGAVLIFTVLSANFIADAIQESTPLAGLGNLVTARTKAPRAEEAPEPQREIDPAALLTVNNLKVGAILPDNTILTLVDGVSFNLHRGETLGLVGESGCGKTLTALAMLGLLPANVAQVGGSVTFDTVTMTPDNTDAWAPMRGSRIGYISQEPMVALDPAYSVVSQLIEPLRIHHGFDKAQARKRAYELLAAVGIADPAAVGVRFPHQLSGGMAQRVAIAIALTGDPDLLVADEPTTALDVTVQAEILDLLRDLQQRNGMALILVTHDLGVVADICDRAVVMYAGQVVEQGPVEDVFTHPQHPYTKGLLESSPHVEQVDTGGGNAGSTHLPTIPGTVPLPVGWPAGCRFAERCFQAEPRCEAARVPLTIGPSREVRCLKILEGATL